MHLRSDSMNNDEDLYQNPIEEVKEEKKTTARNQDLFEIDAPEQISPKKEKKSLLVNDELGFAKTINKTLFESSQKKVYDK